MTVLLIADHDNGALLPATARAVSALLVLNSSIEILVAGHDVSAVSNEAAALTGVTRVLVADDEIYGSGDARSLVALLAPLAGQYSHIAAVSGAIGRDVIPRLAAKLDVAPVSDVVAVHGANRFDRPIYAGNAIETVRVDDSPVLVTIRASAFAPAGREGAGTLAALPAAAAPSGLVRLLAEHRTTSDRPELTTARVVVSGGIALGSRENFAMVEKLAAVLGGAIGATRAAVDAEYAPNDWQVGQTGKIIAPDLYIAIGVSGALQHLAGIQGAKTIVAINADPEAPLVKIADHALIGDLFEAVPALIAALEKRLAKA